MPRAAAPLEDPSSPPVRLGGRARTAYHTLRDLIVEGQLGPGARVIESDVASRLGVSRTPVRSALQRLRQEGYVVAANGRKQSRLSVAPLTRGDGYELFHILAELEGLAAHWAARLPEQRRGQLAGELERVNRALLEAIEDDRVDARRVFDLHNEFHNSYVLSIDAPRIRALYDSIRPQAERYRRVYSAAPSGRTPHSPREHEAIIAAIAEGDAERAQKAAQRNWRNAAERLERVIEDLGERGGW
ncbi:MAG: GntR family transcriptional regulator [Longimicrobiaceae bacterium]